MRKQIENVLKEWLKVFGIEIPKDSETELFINDKTNELILDVRTSDGFSIGYSCSLDDMKVKIIAYGASVEA